MDLSSLEGPPIQDTRFSTPRTSSWGREIPHIRLEHVQSPIDTNRDLPPRPASTDAIPPRNKSPNTGGPTGFWQSQSYRPSHLEDLSSYHPPPTSNPGHSRSATSLAAPEPRQSRPYSHSVSSSSPHQLVWLESEQIWILTTTSNTPTSSSPQPRSSLFPMHAGRSNARRGGGNLSHSRSMEIYPAGAGSGDPEADDIPPPYERHIYDRPLGPVPPAVTRVQPQSMPIAPNNYGSRWAAVGQRMRRTPPT